MKHELKLEVFLPPDWDRIDALREAVGRCVAAMFGEVEMKDAIAMVAAEMLENAVKYGAPNAEGVRLSIQERKHEVVVVVTNAIDAESTHAARLSERVAWLSKFEDPAEAYTSAMEAVFKSAQPAAGGLGMARIAYEGGCRIECDVSRPGEVTVRARHPVGAT